MSTRSGKRIHSSFHEEVAPKEAEVAAKSERKTRSKRTKENLEDLSVLLHKNKKRHNYVSYPTEDELNGDVATNKEEEVIPNRVLRKNALKEQNPINNNENFEKETDAKALIRKSRRGKKSPDDAEENENHENVPADVSELPKSKKNKKKKNLQVVENPHPDTEAPVKKSKKKKKKGKKTSSIIVEDIQQEDNPKNMSLNKSNMSVDSFHSAAGSPVLLDDDNIDKEVTKQNCTFENETKNQEETNKATAKTNKKLTKNSSFKIDDVSNTQNKSLNNQKEVKDSTFNKGSNKRNSLIREATMDLNVSAAINHNVIEKEKQNTANTSPIFNGHLRKRKSSVKDATFEKSNASLINDDVCKDSENNLNNTSHNLRRRTSSIMDVSLTKEKCINNDTFDKLMRTRRSSVKNETFDKDSTKELIDEDKQTDSVKKLRSRKFIIEPVNCNNDQQNSKNSTLKDTTFDKSNNSIMNISNIKTNEEDLNISKKQLRSGNSYIKDSTFDKTEQVINTTFEKTDKTKKDTTFDKSTKKINATYEKSAESDISNENKSNDATFEKDSFISFKKGAMTRKSDIKDVSFDKNNISITSLTKEDFEKDKNIISSSGMKRKSLRRHTIDISDTINENINATFEKQDEPPRKSPRFSRSVSINQEKKDSTYDKDNDKDILNSDSKSSLISSDNSNVTDKDISRISITSDDTNDNIQNIVNTTPVLIESSMDESYVSITKEPSPKPQTPLKREGTFTKDGPEVEEKLGTPDKQVSIPKAGCTPYHVTKSSQKKSMLNVTRSIEKKHGSVDPAPRLTRVMFCSPVDIPVVATQEKRKVIKSNLKGSNKSFVFDESASVSRPSRKRSYTQSDADEARVKRSRLTGELQQSVDRLSRPRTVSAAGKISVTTPSKKPATPSKARSESKLSRTKLPNFAALHQKQFDKMESLGECQERKAKRAKQLLTPTAPPGLLDRISPKNNTDSPKTKEAAKPKEKSDTPTKKLPTLESLRPGFTRFGFKLNYDVNPFSIPAKTDKKSKITEKPVEKTIEKPVTVSKAAILPSLTGATSVRREAAKQTVMREKSFTEKRNTNRNENRTIIKGVRTNRRFELQMKMRNID